MPDGNDRCRGVGYLGILNHFYGMLLKCNRLWIAPLVILTERWGEFLEGSVKKIGLGVCAAAMFAGSAMAADMPVKAPVAMPVPFTWTGIYFGIEGGYAQGKSTNTRNVANSNFPVGFQGTESTSGAIGGFEAGANYQFNWFVLGIEGDFQGAAMSGSTTLLSVLKPGDTVVTNRDTDWLSTVTGRLGLAYDRWMIFGKGGAAWRGANTAATNTVFSPAGVEVTQETQGASTEFGYVVGGGLEWAPVDNIGLKLEYDWYNFGSQSSTSTTCVLQTPGNGCGGIGNVTAPGATTSTPTAWEIKGAINFRFNPFPTGPVVARY
jgi:outer membrane immunogenic protein